MSYQNVTGSYEMVASWPWPHRISRRSPGSGAHRRGCVLRASSFWTARAPAHSLREELAYMLRPFPKHPSAPRSAERAIASCLWIVLGSAVLLLGCAPTGHFVNQVYRRGAITYRLGALPPPWKQIGLRGPDLVFKHPDGGTIATSAQCPCRDDVPLHVLTNHLLFGVEAQKEHARVPLTIDGRGALRTQLRGELDGVPIEMDLVVLKKDGCSYDLQLVASPQHVAARRPDFEALVRGFTTSPGSGTGPRS